MRVSMLSRQERSTCNAPFEDFDDFWNDYLAYPRPPPDVCCNAVQRQGNSKARVRERLPADATGRITYEARANAVKGRMPSVTSAVGQNQKSSTRAHVFRFAPESGH